jgi:hypothetical protein
MDEQQKFRKYELMYSIKCKDLVRHDTPDAGISDGEYMYTHPDHPTIYFVWNEDFYGSTWWHTEEKRS